MRTRIWLPAIVAALGATVPAGATAPEPGGVYGGITPQNWPVIVQVARDGRSITRAAIALDRTCTSGAQYVTPNRYGRLDVSPAGAFSYTFAPVTQATGDGAHTVHTGFLKGRLDARHGRITGTWRLKSVETDAAGATTDTCDSGIVDFTANQ